MAEKLKWADVSHYYQGIVAFDSHGNFYAECSFGRGGICLSGRNMRMISAAPINEVFTPILRAKEDISEPEAREFIAFMWSHISPLPDRIIGEITDKEIRLGQNRVNRKGKPYVEWTAIRFELVGPRGFYWLVSRGFNVFDLEWGTEAIRKEDQNG